MKKMNWRRWACLVAAVAAGSGFGASSLEGVFPDDVHCVGLVAPASLLAKSTVRLGTNLLTQAGYRLKISEGVWASEQEDAQTRAAYLQAMYADPEVDLILCVRGGSGAADTLAHFDYDVLRANDKPLVGFSNISCLLNGFAKEGLTNLVSGPLLSTLVNYNTYETVRRLHDVLARNDLADSTLVVRRAPSASVAGKPLGGHFPSINGMAASRLPDTTGRIVFLEANSTYTLAKAKTAFDGLVGKGWFSNAVAVVLCDLGIDGTAAEKEELADYITSGVDCPVFSGYPYGHVGRCYALDFNRELTITKEGVLSWASCGGDPVDAGVPDETVVIDPGDGVATNVLTRFDGSVRLAVNPRASGGGMVTLNPESEHRFAATLGSGTLVATGLAPQGEASALGADGSFGFGAGTFCYAGPAGATFGLSVTNAFVDGTAGACVLDAERDLDLAGRWNLAAGAFVKDGPGTVTVTDGRNVFGAAAFSDTKKMNLKANGDAPTQGMRGLTVAEGTFRVAGGVNTLGGSGNVLVGAWRDEARPACLEIAGGVNSASLIDVGDHHGGETSVLRVTGGSLDLSGSVYIGRNTKFSGTVNARLEMTGGALSLPGSGQSLFFGNYDTAYVSADISGGTLTVGKNIGVSYQDNSTAAKHVDIVIRDQGVVKLTASNAAQRFYFQSRHANTVCNLTVKDGGTLSLPCLCREASSAVKPTILFDGANVTWTLSIANPFTCGGKAVVADRVYVGTKGLILKGLKSDTTYTYSIPFIASNTTAGAAMGLTLAQGTHCVKAAMAYEGPTTLNGGSLYVDPSGSLPAGTDLNVAYGTFKNGATGTTVRDFTVGDRSNVNIYPGNPLHVTGALAGTGTLNLYTQYGSGNPYQTDPGTYPLVTAPAGHAAELEAFSRQVRYGNVGKVRVTPAVTVSGDVATLSITLAPYTATPAVGADGAVTFDDADGLFRFDTITVNADVAADAANGKFQSFTLENGTVQCTAFNGVGTGATEITLNGGLVEVLDGYFNPGSSSSGIGATVHLNAGATVRAYGVQGTSVAKGGSVYFNGGVVQPIAKEDGGGTYAQNAKFYVSAGGAIFDMQYFRRDFKGSYINLKSPFLHDPALGAAKDGGITVRGGPMADFGSGFRGSTFTGPITVRDNGIAAMYGTYVDVHDYVVRPTARLCHYNNTTIYANDMTLGEEGATEPVTLTTMTGGKNLPGSYVVSNDLQVLSPVTVWTGIYTDELPMLNTGTFTVLVYRASCTIDASRFRPTDLCPNRAATIAETTVADGAYAGWKALVLTVGNAASVPADGTWTAVSAGGAWADSANWGGAEPPKGMAKTAFFNAATGTEVPVALGDGATVTKVYLNAADAAKGYAFSGPLTLQGSGSYGAQLMASNGTHRVDVLALPGAVTLSAVGGAQVEVDHVDGSATLTVDSTGLKKLHLDGFEGSLKVAGSGRTEIDTAAFTETYNDLQLTGTGTLAYRGGDVADVRTRIAGTAIYEIPADVTFGAVVRTNGSTKSTFIKTGAGTFAFANTGRMDFDNVKTAGSYSDAGDFGANGAAPSKGYHGFNVADGEVTIGMVDDPDDAPTVRMKGGAIGIKGSSAGATARLVLNNGTVTSSEDFYLGYFAKNTSVLEAQLVVNGGSMTVPKLACGYVNGGSNKHRVAATIEVNGGELATEASLLMGRDQRYDTNDADKALKHVFRQNGGRTTVGASFIAANSLRGVTAHGWVEVNGGVLDVAKEYQFGGFKGDTSDLWLNGGELRLGGNFVENRNQNNADVPTAAGLVNATLHFNGGMFMPKGDATGVTRVDNPNVRFLVEAGGAVVDTELLTDGAAEYVWEPDLCATNAVDGGLVKRGVGTFVLAGSNTYHGATVVEGGVLKIAGDHALDGTKYLRVRMGGAFDLGGGVCAVPRVYADGLCRNGTLRVTDALVCDGAELDGATYLSVDGNLAFAPGCAIDLGMAAMSEGPSSRDAFPVAVVDGTVEVPGMLKARNAGEKIKGFKMRVVDGVVWATPSAGGTVFIFR